MYIPAKVTTHSGPKLPLDPFHILLFSGFEKGSNMTQRQQTAESAQLYIGECSKRCLSQLFHSFSNPNIPIGLEQIDIGTLPLMFQTYSLTSQPFFRRSNVQAHECPHRRNSAEKAFLCSATLCVFLYIGQSKGRFFLRRLIPLKADSLFERLLCLIKARMLLIRSGIFLTISSKALP